MNINNIYENNIYRVYVRQNKNEIELILESRRLFDSKWIPCVSSFLSGDKWHVTFLDGHDGYTFQSLLIDETIMDIYKLTKENIDFVKSLFLMKELNRIDY